MGATMHDQRGSILIITVIAMLILGVLGVSFALLSNLEVTIGLNYKAQAQAESVAEAGLQRIRDEVRTAAGEGCGFTRWTDSTDYAGCGTHVSGAPQILGAVALGGGSYTAVINNDCSPLVPTGMQDANCLTGSPQRDGNETAIMTAWATAANGQGRARVRAIVGIDNPWKHVCSNSSQDNPPGYCNEPANRNGNPTVSPADPNEYPGGPAAYDDLPRPQLGCSEIDPTLHGATAAACASLPSYGNNGYPYPNPLPAGVTRLVITGDRSKGNCDGGGVQYQGYFDCALSTPCPAAICGASGSVLTRKGCLKPGAIDSRRTDTDQYVEAPCGAHTGMVFTSANVDWPASIAAGPGSSATNGILAYVMRPRDWVIQSQTFYGTVVVEGNGSSGCGGSRDVWHKNGSNVTTAENTYGYPLAYLVFDPVSAIADAPRPRSNPFDPQTTCMDMGSASGTQIHGLIYSGGHVEFNPIVVDGGVIAFSIQTQGSTSTYTYNDTYGTAAPPPGFPVGSGNTVILVRKSFVVCGNYAADSSTPCQ